MIIEKINDEENISKKIRNKNNYYYSLDKTNNAINKTQDYNNIKKNFIIRIIKNKIESKNKFDKINQNLLRLNKITNKNDNLNNLNLKTNISKELKYKIQLQEKNNIINNLLNEIEYYKNAINNKNQNQNNNKNKVKKESFNSLSKNNIFFYSPKYKQINMEIDLNSEKYKNEFNRFHTLDNNERRNNTYKILNSHNIHKKNKKILIKDINSNKNVQKYDFKKLIQNKYNNITHKNKLINNIHIKKINNFKFNERKANNYKNNKIKLSFINSSNSNNNNNSNKSINKEIENNNLNNMKIQMKEIQNRMNNIILNLFTIIEYQKNKII